MTGFRLRTLQRAAALAALLAFAALPHGHLRGHDAVTAARAIATAAPVAVSPAPAHSDGAPHGTCPLCLSLAQVQSALVHGATIALPVERFTVRLSVAAPPLRAAEPSLASSAPRAPPLV
ncbi:MAG TPA: hypothetical protein VNE71_14120 [Myxococcota bacterium]|nr:hypothetical protein [Myxococcota bacterium]